MTFMRLTFGFTITVIGVLLALPALRWVAWSGGPHANFGLLAIPTVFAVAGLILVFYGARIWLPLLLKGRRRGGKSPPVG
jgi:hypothetical protein